MATQGAEDFTKTWFDRFDKAEKAKKAWETAYEVPRCKRYWVGDQLDAPFDEFDQRRMQVNKVHPSVRVSMPSLYFHDPYVQVRANPAIADTPGQRVDQSIDDKVALLRDTGNTLVRDKDTNFDESTHMCLKEAHWAFGCVRVMYDAVPVQNPAVKPSLPLKEAKDTPTGQGALPFPSPLEGAAPAPTDDIPTVLQGILPPTEPPPMVDEAAPIPGEMPPVMIQSERMYVKRIPSRQVIVAPDHTGVISEIPWVGYWSIHYVEDVKNTKAYRNVEDLKPSGIKTNEDDDKSGKDGSGASPAGKIKLFHIWDQRKMVHYVFADQHHKGPLLEKPYKRLPLKFLRLDVDPDSFYPIPPIYHQLMPQDETNDSREWLRKNRKGTVNRYTYDKDAISSKDMRKLETGEMGTYIPREPNTTNVIEPINQPNYSQVAAQTLALSEKEFSEASLVPGERRGVALSDTATQAKIVDTRSQTVESYDRVTVANFLAEIVMEMILLAAENMTLSMWIMLNSDPTAMGYPLDVQNISSMWKEISHTDLETASRGLKWQVVIEESSMSPVAEEEERQAWMSTLAFLENPIMVRLLHFSPTLRKRTLTLNKIKSARDQDLIAQAFAAMVQMEQEMAMMGGPAPKGTASPPAGPKGGSAPPSTPPGMDLAAGPAGPAGPGQSPGTV